jgi:hypothetical protein
MPSIAFHGMTSLPVAFEAHGEERELPPVSLRGVQLPHRPASIPPPSMGVPFAPRG